MWSWIWSLWLFISLRLGKIAKPWPSKMRYFGFASPKFSNIFAVGHDELNEANVPPVVLAEDLRQLQPSGTRRLVVPGQLRAAAPPPPQKAVVTSDHALEY